jgi:hypothetical protein
MRFYNDFDIAQAHTRYSAHPLLWPAVRTLKSLQNGVNHCSDGWPYWQAPQRAVQKLLDVIEPTGIDPRDWYRGIGLEREDVTAAQLKAAYAQLRRFRTRYPQCEFRIYPAPGVPGDPEPAEAPGEVEITLVLQESGDPVVLAKWPGDGKAPQGVNASYHGTLRKKVQA